VIENDFRDLFIERVARRFPVCPGLDIWERIEVSDGSLIVEYDGRKWLVDVQAYDISGAEEV